MFGLAPRTTGKAANRITTSGAQWSKCRKHKDKDKDIYFVPSFHCASLWHEQKTNPSSLSHLQKGGKKVECREKSRNTVTDTITICCFCHNLPQWKSRSEGGRGNCVSWRTCGTWLGSCNALKNIYIFTNANNPRAERWAPVKEKEEGEKVEDEVEGNLQEPNDAHPYKGCRTRGKAHRTRDEDDENKNVMLFEPPQHDEERCER